jgi:hypothetical protein
MKTIVKRLFASLLAVALLALVACFWFGGSQNATAQTTYVFPSRYASAGYTATVVPNLTATIAASTTLSPTNATVTLSAGGFALFPLFQASNAGDSSAVTYTIAPSYDGTNFATTGTLTYAPVANGTTAVIGFTNFSALNTQHIKAIQILSIQNANTHTITNNGVIVAQYAQ